MNSTDRDKARHVVGHHNKLWNDVIAYPQHLTDAIATALAEARKEAEAPYAMCRQVQKRGEHSSAMCACVLAVEESIRAEVRRETWEVAITTVRDLSCDRRFSAHWRNGYGQAKGEAIAALESAKEKSDV